MAAVVPVPLHQRRRGRHPLPAGHQLQRRSTASPPPRPRWTFPGRRHSGRYQPLRPNGRLLHQPCSTRIVPSSSSGSVACWPGDQRDSSGSAGGFSSSFLGAACGPVVGPQCGACADAVVCADADCVYPCGAVDVFVPCSFERPGHDRDTLSGGAGVVEVAGEGRLSQLERCGAADGAVQDERSVIGGAHLERDGPGA